MVRLAEVVIAGGGIGGLATALAVRRSGAAARVRVLERADEFGEVGAGLQLAPNAVRALRRLGLDREIDDYAFYPRRLVMLDALTGDLVTALDLGGDFRSRYDAPYVVMHRSDLLAMLLDEAKQHDDIELCSGTEVTGVDQDDRGVVVRTAPGEEFRADLLVGADGLRSVVRAGTVADGEPIGARYVAYRGTLPFDDVAGIAGGEDVLLWAGPRMHLVQYPIRRGELYNQVAAFESDRYTPDHDRWGDPAELDERFAEACAPVQTAAALIDRSRRWQMLDREPVRNWVHGRIALLGDAAHPMLQYVAQGACQAIEDAVALGMALEAEADVDAALARYLHERVDRVSRVQRTARLFGELIHLAGMGATVRNRLLSARPHDDYSDIDWLYRTA
ncbi:FAD-dependent monooxygenase [Micromonospora echinaurantiaca]|uniref:FAD-dependent monooxygenase n=1 Tax=Micromonospora echinaurantiaca TaxID=47857 RepID=UPI003797CD67